MKEYREKDPENGRGRDERKQNEEERLLDAIGKIDEDLVADAVLEEGRRRRKSWIPAAVAAAACLALVIFAGTRFILRDAPGGEEILQPDSPEELTVIAVGEFLNEGMGYEGMMAHDISELTCENPWREDMELPALPVYKNALTYDGHYCEVSGADFGAMRERLLAVADRLGLEREELTIGDNAPDEETEKIIREKLEGEEVDAYLKPTAVTAEADGIRIEVDMQMRTRIGFEPERALPEQYHFTYESTYEELAALAEYLQETYEELIHMEKPRAEIGYGDYTYAGERMFTHLAFFDTAGSSVDQILNYNFNRIEFNCGENGGLSSVWISQPDLSDLVGNYPIISAEEARALLLKGNYITSVPYEVPGGEYIRRVELVYRNGDYEKYYMPYYRFYVELPEEQREHGLKDYGAYYVPAVEGSYLSDMPTWDGSFN